MMTMTTTRMTKMMMAKSSTLLRVVSRADAVG